MNLIEEIQKIGLTEEDYLCCLQDIQDKLNGISNAEWGEIKEKYNLPVSIEFLRKANSIPFGGGFVKEYFDKQQCDVPQTYVEQMEKIRKEKQKLFDERAALRKISRENARGEANLSVLEDLIRENGKTVFEPINVNLEDKGTDIIACLSDLHMGLCADTMFGKYNSDIARERLKDYLVEIIRIQRLHKSQNIYLVCLGDLINGAIHSTCQLENRENVVQQVQMAAEYIAAFIYELSKHFENVYVSDVAGNHSRIGLKDDVLRDERLDDLVIWYCEAKLGHIKNVSFLKEQYDATIGTITVRDNEYWLCHGDFDKFSEAGLNKLIAFVGHKPKGFFCGHLHHCTYDDMNDVKMIRSGSFAGTCDDFTVSKRLYSKPSQMVCVVEDKGIKALYPVILN